MKETLVDWKLVNVNRTIFVQSQLMRIQITIDAQSGKWTLEGTPADQSGPGDEIVPTQLQLLKIYQEYDLWGKIGPIERVMGAIESKIGRWMNNRRDRKPWKNSGWLIERSKVYRK